MAADGVWQRKSDHELIGAAQRLHEYTNIGQAAIAAELQRRGMPVDLERFEAARVPDEAVPDDAIHDETPQPAESLRSRLWRGEVPLVVTYWGWGLCGNLLLVLALVLIQGVGSAVATALWSLVAASYSFFIMVAIWRSAGRYQGFALWGVLARVAIVVSLLRAVGALFIGAGG